METGREEARETGREETREAGREEAREAGREEAREAGWEWGQGGRTGGGSGYSPPTPRRSGTLPWILLPSIPVGGPARAFRLWQCSFPPVGKVCTARWREKSSFDSPPVKPRPHPVGPCIRFPRYRSKHPQKFVNAGLETRHREYLHTVLF